MGLDKGGLVTPGAKDSQDRGSYQTGTTDIVEQVPDHRELLDRHYRYCRTGTRSGAVTRQAQQIL